jgi:hypothetical protein
MGTPMRRGEHNHLEKNKRLSAINFIIFLLFSVLAARGRTLFPEHPEISRVRQEK